MVLTKVRLHQCLDKGKLFHITFNTDQCLLEAHLHTEQSSHLIRVRVRVEEYTTRSEEERSDEECRVMRLPRVARVGPKGLGNLNPRTLALAKRP